MELSYNNGTAFFFIESQDFIGATKEMKSVNKLIIRDVINFSITEELGKLTTGSLTIRDSAGVYSRILRNGLRFDISFGYKQWNQNLLSLGINSQLPRGVRQGLRCVITTPGGGGDEGGGTTYTVGFHAEEFLKRVRHRVFESGTRGDVIANVMDDLEVDTYIIDFPSKNQRLSTKNSIRQRETSFKFLHELATEWGAFFVIGNKPDGARIGLFVDSAKVASPSVKKYISAVLKIDEEEKEFFYNSGQMSNTKSFSWNQNIGESGQGDSVSISYVEGKPIFTRKVAEGQRVVLWRLNNERLRNEMRASGNISDEIQAFTQIANAKTFDEVKRFFDPIDTETAPQGMGYTINLVAHGDPFLTVMLKVKFKNGFPAPLTQSMAETAMTKFYIKRATHTFSKGEFSTDLEIVDSYTLNGSFIAPEQGDLIPK